MITLRFLIGHGLWIIGAAVVLAAFGYFDWQARVRGEPRRDVLQRSAAWRKSWSSGLLLIASGFLLLETTEWWQRILWIGVWLTAGKVLWQARS